MLQLIERERITRARVLLAQGRPAAALPLLEQQAQTAAQAQNTRLLLETRVLQAPGLAGAGRTWPRRWRSATRRWPWPPPKATSGGSWMKGRRWPRCCAGCPGPPGPLRM